MIKKKVGIMGGTFDPIHIGHLILAQSAYEQLGLDEILFVPAGKPPHKKDKIILATGQQRSEMVRLAIEGNENFVLDTMEIEKQSYSYTFETIQSLCEKYPEDDFYFIIGGDSLRDFHTWKNPEIIAKYCYIAASYRPKIHEDFDDLLEQNRKAYGDKFVKVTAPMLDISSSELREIAESGDSIRYYVPEKVYEYIKENELYERNPNGFSDFESA